MVSVESFSFSAFFMSYLSTATWSNRIFLKMLFTSFARWSFMSDKYFYSCLSKSQISNKFLDQIHKSLSFSSLYMIMSEESWFIDRSYSSVLLFKNSSSSITDLIWDLYAFRKSCSCLSKTVESFLSKSEISSWSQS